eukprot:TRINITY_DN1225_c0_g1_i1.p1 TRINITY_DN1225_c0_g1~~TRINITY_DN1225_c0_g1_i1.p1  ORF type:complete len:600 (+),score=153.08 TRINITY_DN1225_c0_g1_i1:451-2250(+)
MLQKMLAWREQHKQGFTVVGLTTQCLSIGPTLGAALVPLLRLCCLMQSSALTTDYPLCLESPQQEAVFSVVADEASCTLFQALHSTFVQCRNQFPTPLALGSPGTAAHHAEAASAVRELQCAAAAQSSASLRPLAFALCALVLSKALILLDEVSCQDSWQYLRKSRAKTESLLASDSEALQVMQKAFTDVEQACNFREAQLPCTAAKFIVLKSFLTPASHCSRIVICSKTDSCARLLCERLRSFVPTTEVMPCLAALEEERARAIARFESKETRILLCTVQTLKCIRQSYTRHVLRYDVTSEAELAQNSQQPEGLELFFCHVTPATNSFCRQLVARRSSMAAAAAIVASCAEATGLPPASLADGCAWDAVARHAPQFTESDHYTREVWEKLLQNTKSFALQSCKELFGEEPVPQLIDDDFQYSCLLQAGPLEVIGPTALTPIAAEAAAWRELLRQLARNDLLILTDSMFPHASGAKSPPPQQRTEKETDPQSPLFVLETKLGAVTVEIAKNVLLYNCTLYRVAATFATAPDPEQKSLFVCTLTLASSTSGSSADRLPGASPKFVSAAFGKKVAAEKHAALQACKWLLEHNRLDIPKALL